MRSRRLSRRQDNRRFARDDDRVLDVRREPVIGGSDRPPVVARADHPRRRGRDDRLDRDHEPSVRPVCVPRRDDEESAATLGAALLVVSQFTLYADTRKGRRPSWSEAAPAEVAEPLVNAVVEALRQRGAPVETGRFRTRMLVESVNVGPRTVILSV